MALKLMLFENIGEKKIMYLKTERVQVIDFINFRWVANKNTFQ